MWDSLAICEYLAEKIPGREALAGRSGRPRAGPRRGGGDAFRLRLAARRMPDGPGAARARSSVSEATPRRPAPPGRAVERPAEAASAARSWSATGRSPTPSTRRSPRACAATACASPTTATPAPAAPTPSACWRPPSSWTGKRPRWRTCGPPESRPPGAWARPKADRRPSPAGSKERQSGLVSGPREREDLTRRGGKSGLVIPPVRADLCRAGRARRPAAPSRRRRSRPSWRPRGRGRPAAAG